MSDPQASIEPLQSIAERARNGDHSLAPGLWDDVAFLLAEIERLRNLVEYPGFGGLGCIAKGHPHDNPSPSHFIGAWCNSCGMTVPLDQFDPTMPSYFVDGRNHGLIAWNSERQTWEAS